MAKKILLAEDEEMLGGIVRDTLEAHGFEVALASDGKIALSLFQSFSPDLIILDVMMPERSGYEVAEIIRKTDKLVPIIFLTAKSQTVDVLKGFSIGANDYVKKPFSLEELVARVQVLLRNAISVDSPGLVYSIGRFTFDVQRQMLTLDVDKQELSFKEAQLLTILAASINQVVEKNDVLFKLWGDNSIYNSRNMDVVITRIRQHLKGDDKVKIINIRGIGYKLTVEE